MVAVTVSNSFSDIPNKFVVCHSSADVPPAAECARISFHFSESVSTFVHSLGRDDRIFFRHVFLFFSARTFNTGLSASVDVQSVNFWFHKIGSHGGSCTPTKRLSSARAILLHYTAIKYLNESELIPTRHLLSDRFASVFPVPVLGLVVLASGW